MDLPYDKIVIFRKNKVSLRYAMDHCELGETIGDIDISLFDDIIKVLIKERGIKYRYAVDDKYGKWRLILASPHKNITVSNGYFIYADRFPPLPEKIKPLKL